MYVNCVHVCCPRRPEEGIKSLKLKLQKVVSSKLKPSAVSDRKNLKREMKL